MTWEDICFVASSSLGVTLHPGVAGRAAILHLTSGPFRIGVSGA